jgi:hypothetical protein
MAKTDDPLAAAQKAVDQTAQGWRVDRAQEPTAQTSTSAHGMIITARPGEYSAWKRNPNGNTLVEMIGDTLDQLTLRIADWERSQHPAEQPEPTPEQMANTVAATESMAVTHDARGTS